MNTELLLRARELLRDLTPLKSDCGLLCGAACCKTDEDGQGGSCLFPGEEALLPPGLRIETLADMGGCRALFCDAPCERAERPLCCRLFPLTPARRKDGRWGVRLDRRAWAVCPLMKGGLRGLNPAFVWAADEAVALLSSDEVYKDFLSRWAARERAYAQPL